MKKRILSLALALALALPLCLSMALPARAAAIFPDVSSAHWAYDDIQKCCSMGIVKGHDDGTFKPEDAVTGAEFATMLTRAFYPSELAANGSLSSRGWYTPALTTAYSAGLLSGTSRLAGGYSSNWSSSADLPLSRYDMAQMLSNILSDKGITTSSDQRNASKAAIRDWSAVPSQYQSAVLNCYALGVLRGMEDGSFAGGNTMNRAEACAVINRETGLVSGGASTAPDPSPSAPAGGAEETLDFSESYKSSKYYAALKAVILTGDYRQDIMNIAASQIGYHESNQENQLDGSGTGGGNYSEYGRALGSNGRAWCSEFASWCIRQAGVPTDIIRSSRSASVSTFNAPYYTWSQTAYAGGTYTPQPGDLALFAWSGTELTDPYLSHTAIVSGVKQESGKVNLSVIHGNANDSVCRSVYVIDAATGQCSGGRLGYFVAPNYGPSSVQNYDPQETTPAPDPEPVLTLSQTSVALSAGKTASLSASTNQPSARVTYTSGNTSVAKVDQSGTITGVKAGTTVITASITVNGKRVSEQCTVTVTAAPQAEAKTPQQLAADVVELVNQERAKQGLPALGTVSDLTAAAEVRAPELAKLFEHTRPDGSSCFTALKEAGVSYYAAGENIAAGPSTAAGAMQMWMNSSGHKANILNSSFTHIGVGYYKGYWVQMFIGSAQYESGSTGSGTSQPGTSTGGESGSQPGTSTGDQTGTSTGGQTGSSTGEQTGTSTSSPSNTLVPGGNPGKAKAVRSSLPENRVTKHYREDWSNGDYYDITVSGNTLTFSGRYTARTVREADGYYNYVLLRAFGGGNEACTPFVNGQEFRLSVQIDMDAFTRFWNEDPRPRSHVATTPVMNFTPGASSYVSSPYQAADSICLVLDDSNELAVYVKD